MDELLNSAEFWHWWVGGAVLLGIEIVTGTFALLWAAMAAGVVGVILFFFPGLGWEAQFLLFALLAVSSAAGWYLYQKSQPPTETDQPSLNRRGTQYIDRHFTLEDAVVNGQGKLRIDDTIWKIEGEDMPEGTKVRVTGLDGTMLRVERADRPVATDRPAPAEGQ